MRGRWDRLEPGAYRIDAHDPGVDPMWVWSDATNYRDHGPGFPHPADGVPIAMETSSGGDAQSPCYTTRWVTPADWHSVRRSVLRAALQLPIAPQRVPWRAERAVPQGPYVPERSTARTLVGVIDSGCPFASRALRGAGGGTRVLGLWDQDPVAPAFTQVGGRAPARGGGCAIPRAALDALIARNTSTRLGVAEEAIYQAAGLELMRWKYTHGAAVIGQLFSPPVRGGALQPRPGDPPPWDSDLRALDEADLVFVDLSRASLLDGTSAALARNVIDGLDFIESHIGGGTERVVVNLSAGTARTLHDGTSLLERALLEFVKRRGPQRWIVLPAGNENMAQLHGVLGDAASRLELSVPPGSEMPQYVTVRWPEHVGAGAWRLRVTTPHGQACDVARGEARGWGWSKGGPVCGIVSAEPLAWDDAAMSLIVFGATATAGSGAMAAPAGRWRIELVPPDGARRLPEPVHFWVSPNARNPCMPLRSGQAAFVDWDESFQPRRWLRLQQEDCSDPPTNGLLHGGALDGLATVFHPRIVVAGAVVAGANIADARRQPATRYSSAGPAAGRGPDPRRGPDVCAPGDAGWALPGQCVRASRSGAIARVSGTSFTAPLVARAIVQAGGLPVTPAANETARRGPSLGGAVNPPSR